MSRGKVIPIRPEEPPRPTVPAGHILKFRPRTEVIGTRCPPEVAARVRYEASIRYMSVSHFTLRIITAFLLAEENELRKQISDGRAA